MFDDISYTGWVELDVAAMLRQTEIDKKIWNEVLVGWRELVGVHFWPVWYFLLLLI